MNGKWKQKAAAGMITCLIFSSIPAWTGNGDHSKTYKLGDSRWGITAYASSSNAEKADNTENDEHLYDQYTTASSSDGDELLIDDINEIMLTSLKTDSSGTTAVVGSQVDEAYASIADVFNDLGENTGVLTIELHGDTEDTEPVVFPRDKGIKKIIICGDQDYQIGAEKPVSVIANGIPMIFEAGYAYNLAGGGWNTSVSSTDLTVTGGKFTYCFGGAWVTESNVDASVKGTAKLTIDNADLTDSCFNHMYCGSKADLYVNNSDISIQSTELTIVNSSIDMDMISGGSYAHGHGVNASLDRSEIMVDSSIIVLGDGLCGSHIFDGVREDLQNVTCGSVNIEIYDSTIEGDILGGGCGTSDGIVDMGSIRIYGENSNIASIQAGGVYQGAFHFQIDHIDVILDSCTINGSHWFEEEFSMIGAGCYIGEKMTNPEDDLHLSIGTINYTFLNSVLDETEDEGIEGLLCLPEGFIDEGANASIGTITLTLNADTAFTIENGVPDLILLSPPVGYRFSTASINGNEIERDEMDTASVTALEDGSEVITVLEKVELKDQPSLIIEHTENGKIKKTIGEPDFILKAAGGEDSLKTHYTSSNPSVAEVDETGKISLKKTGKSTITAYKQSVEYNRVSAQVELTVEEPAASLIPEQEPAETGYVLVAKKVTPDIQKTIEKELVKHPQFSKDTTVIPMEIQLIDVTTGEEVHEKGSTFIISYPDEDMKRNPDLYEISILHIPSNGQPYFVPYKLTEQGIRITVENFSPFIMGYKRTESVDNGDDDTGDNDNHESGDQTFPKPARPQSTSDNTDGELSGRWILDGNGWWYHYDNGTYPSSQWAYLPYGNTNSWYYFNSAGYMADGWLTWNGNKYFLHDQSDGRRGSMYTGWHQILGKWYYFSSEDGSARGALMINAVTPDGYQVDENGVWIP